MDPHLRSLIEGDTPRLNPLLANGLACSAVNSVVNYKGDTRVEEYVDKLLKSAAPSFPEELRYTGFKRCTPEEEYAWTVRPTGKNKVRSINMAHSSVFLVRYSFTWNGQKLPDQYLYLPYLGEAGSIYLRGTRFFIAPVLGDPVISASNKDVFIRLLKAKLIIKRDHYRYLVNWKTEQAHIHYSRIYNPKRDKQQRKVRGRTLLAHYLFCKYGFTDTFLKFANCRPVAGYTEINPDNYPDDEWLICTSRQLPPRDTKASTYQPSELRLAIRKEEFTHTTNLLVGALFYVVDRFPQRLVPRDLDARNLWRILLGFFIFGEGVSEGILQGIIDKHMGWVDEYLDNFTQEKIDELGLPVTNTYELFAYVMEHFLDLLYPFPDADLSMYDKQLEVLYYLCSNIMHSIHQMCFSLRKPSKRRPDAQGVAKTLRSFIKPYLIFKINRQHAELSSKSYSGDNAAIGITGRLVLQERYPPPKKLTSEEAEKPRTKPVKALHVSVAEIGNYLKLGGGTPDGRDNINLHVKVDARGYVMRHPQYRGLLDEVEDKIRRNAMGSDTPQRETFPTMPEDYIGDDPSQAEPEPEPDSE